jgi:hypothetical protein
VGFSEESAFVAQIFFFFFFGGGQVELGSERSPWYESMLLLYEIPHVQLPSLVYLVFASNGVGKGPL